MKLKLASLLWLCSVALADTPPPVINKTCPTSQWIWKIVPGQQPTCKQPYYSDIAGAPPASAAAWGSITGTLSNQTDLQSALNAKQDTGNYLTGTSGDVTSAGPGVGVATLANTAVTAGSYTSANITVDAKGRITSASNGGGGSVNNVTATLPLSSSGGTTPDISIRTASGAQSGALSAADWTTFNSKQVAGDYVTALTSDVSASGPGSAVATVNSVGGSTASAVNSGVVLANAATSANTVSTIVRRDGSGNFLAGTISAALSGNATTATALAANPSDCSSGLYADAIDAQGNLTCASVTDAQLSTTDITTNNVSVSKHGFAPKAPNDSSLFLNGVGGYSAPAGTAGITVLTGDVTGTGPGSTAATVAFVGGSAASAVNTATVLANAATAANTASTIVKRDANSNTFANNQGSALRAYASSGSTDTLTAASNRYQVITGSAAQNVNLPNATTLINGHTFEFRNQSSLAASIRNTGASSLLSLTSGQASEFTLVNNSTANGTWEIRTLVPSNVQFGTIGLNQSVGYITAPGYVASSGLSLFNSGTNSLGTGAIEILSPSGFAGPVLNFKSNGSQVAYISDLGNTLFQHVAATGGLATDTISAYNDPEIKASSPIIPNSDNTQTIGKSGSVFNQIWGTTLYGDLRASNGMVSGELELAYSTGALRFSGSNGKLNWQLQNGPGTGDYTWYWPQEVPGSTKTFQIDASGVITLVDYPSPATPALASVIGAGNSAGGQSIIDLSTLALVGNGHNLTLSGSSSMGGDVSFVFPPDYGSSGYVLQTDGGGNLSWQPATGSAVTNVTATSPLFSSGGTTPDITIQTASGAQAGALSAADWTTFNGKQASGNYVTALTGDVTASGPGSSAATLATVNSNVGSFTNSSITVNAKGLITAASSGTAPVASVALSVPATSIFGVTGSPVTTTGTLGLTTAGTSGGIPYFNTTSTLSSSAALTANRLILGGGAGAAPSIVGSLGTTTTVLHGNASGAPTFGAVALGTDVSGTLLAAQFPALTGDITTSAGSVVTTAAATQANITSLSNAAGVAVHGVATNSSASAGYVGEVISSAIGLTNFDVSGNYSDLTSISLTAGDWLVSLSGYAATGGATVSSARFCISATSGNSSTGCTDGDTQVHLGSFLASDTTSPGSIVNVHVQLTGTTTYYFKIRSVYSVATPQATGRITAVRIR